jgi:hypothetical protein
MLGTKPQRRAPRSGEQTPWAKDLRVPAGAADFMRAVIFGIYILGAALVCSFVMLAVVNRVPGPVGVPLQLLAAIGSGYYGFRQAKKNEAAHSN